MIFETNSSGEISNFYEYGLDLVKNRTSETYYNYNAHGDVVQLTDSEGAVTADYTYDAFGNTQLLITDSNPFRYCGEYTDSETGNIYLRNRYYNPSTGRFINEDPIRDGLNWYSYCGGNPIRLIDPLGLRDVLTQEEKTSMFVSIYNNSIFNYNWNNYLYDFDLVNSNIYTIRVGYNLVCKDLDLMKNARADNNIEMIGYDIKSIDKCDTTTGDNLCWAICDVMLMIDCFDLDITNKEACNLVDELNKYENGDNLNQRGFTAALNPDGNLSFENICKKLEDSGTGIYGDLKNINTEENVGHSILITSAYTYNEKNYIAFNDPQSNKTQISEYNGSLTLGNESLVSISVVNREELESRYNEIK